MKRALCAFLAIACGLTVAVVPEKAGLPAAVCPKDSLIAFEGLACCPKSCGKCGGSGCEKRPGGAASCCQPDILAVERQCSVTDKAPCIEPEVPNPCPPGAIPSADRSFCCDAKCGSCGGPGCGTRVKGLKCCRSYAGVTLKPCTVPGALPCVVATKDPTTCAAGLIPSADGRNCCLASCGVCEADVDNDSSITTICAARKGGRRACCPGNFQTGCDRRPDGFGCNTGSNVCRLYEDCGYPASARFVGNGGIKPADVKLCCDYGSPDQQRFKTMCVINPDGTDSTICAKPTGPICKGGSEGGPQVTCGELATPYGWTQHTACCNPAGLGGRPTTVCIADPKGGYRTVCAPEPKDCTSGRVACGGIALRTENYFCCKPGEKCYLNPAFYDGRTACFAPTQCAPGRVACGAKLKLYEFDGVFARSENNTRCCAAGQQCYTQGNGKASICKTPKACAKGIAACGAGETIYKVELPNDKCCAASERCLPVIEDVNFTTVKSSKCVPRKQ